MNHFRVAFYDMKSGSAEEAGEIAERARARLEEVRDAYRSLVLRMRNAEEAIAEVEGWGFDVTEPRGILTDARRRIDSGAYAGYATDSAGTLVTPGATSTGRRPSAIAAMRVMTSTPR